MNFEGHSVPGANWVEIVKITNKDGSELAPDNWRHKLFGQVSVCWIAGGLRHRGAYFKGKVRMENGQPVEVDLFANRWTSTTEAQPVEVEPGVFDLETNTSIYRLRLLTEEEEAAVSEAVKAVFQEELRRHFGAMEAPPAGAGEGIVS